MKRIINFLLKLSFILFFVFGVSSCGKGDNGAVDDSEDAYLTCKINGQPRTFNYHVNANDKPEEDVVHFVVISGWETENTAESPGFGIDMLLPEGAEEKTYTVSGNQTPELNGQYYIQNVENGKIVSTTTYMGGNGEGTNFILTITSLTDWGVKGTFSGVLRLSGEDELITITDGTFSAPYN